MKVALFGVGHVGSAVVRHLRNAGHEVVSFPHRDLDVSVQSHFESLESGFDAVVYCVGHCPPGGFPRVASVPLSRFPSGEFQGEVSMHEYGVLNVLQCMFPRVTNGSRFVFLSSAATRLLQMPRDKRPSQLHIYHHIAVIAAMGALIEGMRIDPEVKRRGIRIDVVLPPAIDDSPFHQDGPKLPVTVSTDRVVEAIYECVMAGDADHLDKNLVPPTPVS